MKSKKMTILLTFALASTLFVGCGAKKDTAKNPWDEKPELQKETVSYKKELIISDGEVGAWYIYEYDEKGNEIYVSNYCEYEGEICKEYCVKEYDENGNVLLETYYQDGEKGNYYQHEYDENGNEISFDCYGKNGWYSGYVKEYNEKNLCTLKQLYSWVGDEKKAGFYTEYIYDDNGNLIKEVQYDPEGKETSIGTYSINQEGKPYYMECKSADEKEPASCRYYTYDYMGNIINETLAFNDKSLSNIYEYDDQGRMIKYVTTGTTSEGSTVVIYEYSYHEVK